MQITIRRCHDRELIKRMDLRVFVNTIELAKPSELDNAAWWVAFRDGEPVGFCGVQRARTEPGSAYLSRAGVLQSARGNGLQRRFLRCRERWARDQGMEAAITYTLPTNYPSMNNLIASGYRTCAGSYLGSDVVYWRKRLTAVEVQSDEQ